MVDFVINARFLTQKITGVQRVAIEFSKRIKEMRPGTIFLSPRNIIHDGLAGQLEARVIGSGTGHIWEQFELPLYLYRHGRPLLVNFQNVAPILYANKITTIHDLAFMRNPSWFTKRFYYAYRFFIPMIIGTSKLIVTDSDFSKTELMDVFNVKKEKIHVVYPAVADFFHKQGNTGYGRRAGGKYLLTVSSIDPRKNLINVIKSFSRLKRQDYKLVIIGSRNRAFNESDTWRFLKDQPNVIFTGYIEDEDLTGYYAGATLFIFLSFYEGFGLPPLEAMACGCPTLVSNMPCIPEICGDASVYADPNSIDDIVMAMDAVLDDEKLAMRLIKRGKERVKKFSWDKSTGELLELIDGLTEGGIRHTESS